LTGVAVATYRRALHSPGRLMIIEIKKDFLMAKKLNIKQQRFLEHYLKSGNGSDAIIKSGYKTKWPDREASRLLNHPLIKKEVDICRERVQQKIDVSLDWRLNILKEIAETGENSDRIRAISEINKVFGDYAPVKQINTNINVDDDLTMIQNLTNEYMPDEFKAH
jgi:phage terminase small subunit